MKQEINPALTSRSRAFEFWMSSPMPMVTIVKTFDISHLIKKSRKKKWKLNMLLCWSVGCAASRTKEFYLLPENIEGQFSKNGRLMQYADIAINVIVRNKKGGISSCDIPYSADIEQFNRDYLRLTQAASLQCESSFTDDAMVIGTSAVTETEIDSIFNQYTDKFCNPMLLWGRYKHGFLRTTLPISFQFHHVQMDGGEAAKFMELLQTTIKMV